MSRAKSSGESPGSRALNLECYVYPGWEPRIRPAATNRDWMDAAPESFPYRCLPLAIANSHGWEILSPCGFEAVWNGGLGVNDVTVHCDPGTPDHLAPVALFGQGTFTIHVQGLLRTPPGFNLFVSGPPNFAKDGVAPLSGIIETDWSPYTFTMNWRLTCPNRVVRFEENEPCAFFFPIERGLIENFQPRYLKIDENPELKGQFEAWSRSRDAFQRQVREHPPERPADKWQKLYYRGLLPNGDCPAAEHQSKLRIPEFESSSIVDLQERNFPVKPRPATESPTVEATHSADWTLRKYEWLLETAERQRALSSEASSVFRISGISEAEFLDGFYAPGRPAVLCELLDAWPALSKWTPAYLKERIGPATIECQSGREADARFELDKDRHRQRMAFDAFIDRSLAGSGNDIYMTAYNSAANATALAPLNADLGFIGPLLDQKVPGEGGMIWIGPKGTFTPLHHDLTNNLLVQVTGRKRVILAAPGETPKLSNSTHVFSDIPDLTANDLDLSNHPRLRDVRLLDIILEPGEALYIPVGWWHQVNALDFSVSITYTNFRWPNDAFQDHPTR